MSFWKCDLYEFEMKLNKIRFKIVHNPITMSDQIDCAMDEEYPLIDVQEIKQPCGCIRMTTYNHDEEFDGYETDREEIEEKLCTTHEEQLKEKAKIIQMLNDQFNWVAARLQEARREYKNLKKELFRRK